MLVQLVSAGNCEIGMKYPVRVQTMCNTFTQDVEKSVAQCEERVAAAADLIRLTTQGLKAVEALKEIKAILRGKGKDKSGQLCKRP